MPNTAETLASVVGGGLQGFVQGRQAKMQRENAKARQDRQFKLDQSREERQNQKYEAEKQEAARKESAFMNSIGILRRADMLDPTLLDVDTNRQFRSTFMQEWAKTGRRVEEGRELYDTFAESRGITKPLSAEEQAKLTKAERENQVFTVTPEIAKEFGLPEGTKLSVDDLRQLRSTATLNRQRESQIAENQANISRIRKASDKPKNVKEKERDLVKELRDIGLALTNVEKDSEPEKVLMQLEKDVTSLLDKKRREERLKNDVFYQATQEGGGVTQQQSAKPSGQPDKRKEAEEYLKRNNLPVTDNNINFYLNSVK